MKTRLVIDDAAGAAYLSLTKINAGDAVRTIEIPGTDMLIDLNKHGQLLGVEFLSLNELPQPRNRKERRAAKKGKP